MTETYTRKQNKTSPHSVLCRTKTQITQPFITFVWPAEYFAFINDLSISHLKVFLVESEVVEFVGEGVDDGDELCAPDVGLGVEHEGDVERLLLPHEGVQELHEGGRQVADELHLLQDADADVGGQGSDLEFRTAV